MLMKKGKVCMFGQFEYPSLRERKQDKYVHNGNGNTRRGGFHEAETTTFVAFEYGARL